MRRFSGKGFKTSGMSPWIWRRFYTSYRAQNFGLVTVPGYPWNATGPVGLGLTYQNGNFGKLLGAGSGNTATIGGQFNAVDETGITSPSTPANIPVPYRRIAVKRVAGVIDLFPLATTLSLGDLVYVHVAIMKRESSVGTNYASPLGVNITSPMPQTLQDTLGKNSRPLWYRRVSWFFGTYGGLSGNILIQQLAHHVKVNLRFRSPLVLGQDEDLMLAVWTDYQPGPFGALGVYNTYYLNWLSFLVKIVG